jgi:putative glutamine amidotransferase
VTRPRIGVTLAHDTRTPGRYSLRRDYVQALGTAGGLVLALPPGPPEDVDVILGQLDGVVLTGGTDLDPKLFGEEPHPAVNQAEIFRDRDRFELALCRAAVGQDVPLLAICRGVQVLNVAFGGTLVQDIPSQVPSPRVHDTGGDRHALAHDVAIEPGSRLFEILGRRPVVPVNSFHHQSIATVGAGLAVSARADDGVIEAVERRDCRFVVGVQWHPEGFVGQGDDFHPLFAAFLEACGAACRA